MNRRENTSRTVGKLIGGGIIAAGARTSSL